MQYRKPEPSRSEIVRERLDHPIIDSDGHTAEFEPALFDYLRDAGGPKMVERYKSAQDNFFTFPWYRHSPDERRAMRIPRPLWWVHPTRNTLDRATSSLPKLMYDRMAEMGLDFSVIYPSLGLIGLHTGDDELRRAFCRAYNNYQSEFYGPFSDRMTPAAIIPMHSPEEALEELEHVVQELKLKVVLLAGYVRRPVSAAVDPPPHLARFATWLDTYGIDSDHNYDPVWKKCVELGVAPTFHSAGVGWGSRNSISNFMYNHIGHFAAAGEALCKSLFFGGVTRRFPTLRFTFLEGGVGWACSLFNDLVGHWRKHNLETIEYCNPANLDTSLLRELFDHYGENSWTSMLEKRSDRSELLWGRDENPRDLDEWSRCDIDSETDIHNLFVPSFYFGCEGDDRLTGWAFDKKKNELDAQLNAIYGSDIGHFDVMDMRDAAAEPWELVEKEILTEEEFRDFVFVNPVMLKTHNNPDFFKGTAIEEQVTRLLKEKDLSPLSSAANKGSTRT